MGKFKLAFGIHNHQPVGNFTAVFDEAHRNAYRPFLELLHQRPEIRLSLHQSGILWDWQKHADPAYFELVGSLVDRGQVELMTGGFYEPILTAVPARDARGQIDMLSSFLTDHFDVRPQGLWLTERIWEPHLPKLLHEAGVKYLPIDDTHFIYAGFEHAQLTGPFVTEEEGHRVILLPIQKRLRYLIPFGTVETLMTYLRQQAECDSEGMAVYADDGEKFGVWPHTHEHCYRDGWLVHFFDEVARNSDWLEVIPLAEAAACPPVGRAYLPTASYEEMLHWSLPSRAFVEYEAFEQWLEENGEKERFGRFVRGGHWRGFLTKYDESNLMHKKMLFVSDALAEALRQHPDKQAELAEVRQRLYAGQCNCPYWHGVFGGLYLPHIRQAVYGNLVAAHHRLHRITGSGAPSVRRLDYDCDGHDEVVFDSQNVTAVIKPRKGGTLLDLSLNNHAFCLTDTLSRRREGYHRKLDHAVPADSSDHHASIHDLVLTKEEGLSRLLAEDAYLKRCFIDHFLTMEVTPEEFQAARFTENGDFVAGDYRVDSVEDAGVVVLRRDGMLRTAEGHCSVQLVKEFRIDSDIATIQVSYHLSTSHPGGCEVVFAVENNINFQAGHAMDRYVVVDGQRPPESFLDSAGSNDKALSVALIDEYRQLAAAVLCESPAAVWRLPIFTVSLSEAGFEKVYQGTTVVHRTRLHLGRQPMVLRFALVTGTPAEVLERCSRSVPGLSRQLR